MALGASGAPGPGAGDPAVAWLTAEYGRSAAGLRKCQAGPGSLTTGERLRLRDLHGRNQCRKPRTSGLPVAARFTGGTAGCPGAGARG